MKFRRLLIKRLDTKFFRRIHSKCFKAIKQGYIAYFVIIPHQRYIVSAMFDRFYRR